MLGGVAWAWVGEPRLIRVAVMTAPSRTLTDAPAPAALATPIWLLLSNRDPAPVTVKSTNAPETLPHERLEAGAVV